MQEFLTKIARAYERFEQESNTWLKSYTASGGQVFCKAGCFHCCNLPIQVSLAESLYTVSRLEPEQQKAMQTRAYKVIENAKTSESWDMYFERHRQEIGYCPLLENGKCSAYDARPARCRDTFSAFDSRFCAVGTLENLSKKEHLEYQRQVRKHPATDGQTHYIQPLEDIGASIWETASQAMRQAWGLEVWGDFWVLTALAADETFMEAIWAGQGKKAISRAKALGLWHLEIVQFS